MDGPTSPARQSRHKRLSHEQEEAPAGRALASFLHGHKAPLLATFVLANVWFANVVAPLVPSQRVPASPAKHAWLDSLDEVGLTLAVGGPGLLSRSRDRLIEKPAARATSPPQSAIDHTIGFVLATGNAGFLQLDNASPSALHPPAVPSPPLAASSTPADMHAFVLTCALVHTLLVAIGLAAGSDTLGVGEPAAGASARTMLGASFCVLCASLFWSWEYSVGPVPPVARRLFGNDEMAYVLVGAASATSWLAVSMLVPHLAAGRAWAASPRLCALTAAAGASVHLFEPAGGAAGCAAVALLTAVGSTAALTAHRGVSAVARAVHVGSL